MNQPRPVSRRTLLSVGGTGMIAVGAVALTACSPDGGSGASAQSGSQPPAGGSNQSASGTTIVPLADIPVGGTLAATLNGKPILLAQPTAGTVVAFSAICTHQGCVVSAKQTEFDCGCHGSRFAAATGKVLQGPAQKPLVKIAVTISGTSVITA